MLKTNWLVYTVLIGAIPFLARAILFVCTVNKQPWTYIINEVDIVTFGLVLHVSSVNELSNRSDIPEKKKSDQIGWSILLISLMSILLGLAYFGDIIKPNPINLFVIRICSIMLSLVSLVFSYSIYHR